MAAPWARSRSRWPSCAGPAGSSRAAAARPRPSGPAAAAPTPWSASTLTTWPALASRFAEASDGPTELIIDPLYGAPAAAALRTARRYARLVQLGSSAAETAPIDSSTVRSRSLCLLGYTNNELTPTQRADAFNAVLALAATGRLTVGYESVPLDKVSGAWSRQARGEAPVRIVITS